MSKYEFHICERILYFKICEKDSIGQISNIVRTRMTAYHCDVILAKLCQSSFCTCLRSTVKMLWVDLTTEVFIE